MSKENSWKEAVRHKRFRLHLLVSGIGVIFLVSFLPYFFNTLLLPKQGVVLNDFILQQFAPKDWSWIIFGLIYLSIVLTVFFNYTKPYTILLGVESYITINLIRMITLYGITLEPPPDIIPLIDPLITKVAYGNVVYLKDLFFSGHVSTLVLLFLIEGNKTRKSILLALTIVVALLILWQHVHYSVDIIFAPIFSWLVFSTLGKIHAGQFPIKAA